MSRVTVQNIADALGLSKFAVSRALAGKSGVSEDTRRLITRTGALARAVATLGARPGERMCDQGGGDGMRSTRPDGSGHRIST